MAGRNRAAFLVVVKKNASRQAPLPDPLGTLLRWLGVCQVFEDGIDNKEKEERKERVRTSITLIQNAPSFAGALQIEVK
jgi:hypothetical protein